MNRSQGWLILALAALVAGGCRTPHGLEDLERELRYQEDVIYELQDYIGTYKSHLNECRKENQRLRREAGEDDGGPSGGGRLRSVDDIAPPEDGLVPPVIELPGLDGDEGESLDDTLGPLMDAAQNGEPSAAEFAKARFPQDDHVAALTLDESATWASSSRGVEILVEPRNAGGQIVPAVGEISVAILDPAAATADEARVARWQFTAEQTRLLARDAQPGAGLRLELLWPDGPPQNQDLRLFVRIVTPDGQRYVAEQDLRVGAEQLQPVTRQPPQKVAQPQSASGWTARTRPRPPVSSEANRSSPSQRAATDDIPSSAHQIPQQRPTEQRPPNRAARLPEWSPYR